MLVGTSTKFEPVKENTYYRCNEDIFMSGETCPFSSKFQYQTISCMTIYNNKSLEELRTEDYLLGRKGVNGTTTATTSIFGGPSTTTTTTNTGFNGFRLGAPLAFGNNTATNSTNTTPSNLFGSSGTGTSASTGFKFNAPSPFGPATFGNNTTTSNTSTPSFFSPFRTPSTESMDTTSDGPIFTSPFPNSASQLITFNNKPNPFQIQTNPFQTTNSVSTSPFTSQTQFKIGLGNTCSSGFKFTPFAPTGQNNSHLANNQNRFFNCLVNNSNNNCNQSPFGQQTQLYMVLRPLPIWGFTFSSQAPIFNQNLNSNGIIDHNRQIVIPSVSSYTPAQIFGVQPYPDLPPFRYSSYYDFLSKPKPVRSHISWTDNILRSKSRPYLFSYDTELKDNYEKSRVVEKKPSKEEIFSQNFYHHGRNVGVGSPSLSSLFYPKNRVRPTPTIWFPSISTDLRFGRHHSRSTNTDSYPMMSEPPRSNDDIFPPRNSSQSPLYRTNSYIFTPRKNNLLSSPSMYTRTSWKTLDYPKVKDLMKKEIEEMDSRESKRKFERQNEGSPFYLGKMIKNQSLGFCGDNNNSNTSSTNGSQTSSGYGSFSRLNSNESGDWEYKRSKIVNLHESNEDEGESQDMMTNDEKNADFIRRPTKEERPSQVVLTKQNEGYYCMPDVKELDKLSIGQNGLGDSLDTCLVENFKIGQKNVGFIIFPGTIDVYGLNLNEIVDYLHSLIFEFDSDGNIGLGPKKPQIIIQMQTKIIVRFNVWPLFGKETPMAVNNVELKSNEMRDMKNRVDAFCSRIGGFLVKFEPEMGTFIFKFK